MPEMQDLHNVGVFLNLVVDENRRMDKLANTWAAGHWAANIREGSQNIEVVEEGVAKAFGCGRKVGPGILDDGLELG